MRAILDTNILLSALRGNRPSNDLRLVLADAAARRFVLVVPQLVVDEVVNKRREAAEAAARSLRKVQSDLAEIGVDVDVPPLDPETVANQFRLEVEGRLSKAKVEIPGYPDIGHDGLVRRALDRRKPFGKGDSGYRDALLWETVLASAANDDVILITCDNDFSEAKDGTALASDLADDLTRIGAEDRVRLIRSLAAFKQEFVAATTIASDNLQQALNSSDSPLRAEFFRRISERLARHVFDRYDFDNEPRDWWDRDHLLDRLVHRGVVDAQLEGASVRKLERLLGVWVYRAEALGDEVLVEFEAEVDADVELEVDVTVEEQVRGTGEPRERYLGTQWIDTGRTLLIGGEARVQADLSAIVELGIHGVKIS